MLSLRFSVSLLDTFSPAHTLLSLAVYLLSLPSRSIACVIPNRNEKVNQFVLLTISFLPLMYLLMLVNVLN